MEKIKVLFILHTYPQKSQTYVSEEVNSIFSNDKYDCLILNGEIANGITKNHHPYVQIHNNQEMIEKAVEFQPDIIHTHYIHMIPIVELVAKACNAPYTIRTHSYDVLGAPYVPLDILCPMAKSDLCLRILAFPLCTPILIKHGAPKEKVVDCYPTILYDRFKTDPDIPHKLTGKILNVGAAIAKKKYEDFIDLAKLMNEDGGEKFDFELYALGYKVEDIKKYNEDNGGYVRFDTAEPEDMGEVYRSADWLVYTADTEMATVCWPLALAEAQAAGIGVCFKNIEGREESLNEFLGGVGYLYNSIEELPEIIRGGFADDKRRIGIEHAKKSDINAHIHLLTDVWEAYYESKTKNK